MTKLDNVINKIEKARLGVDSKRIVKIVAISKYSTITQIQELYNDGQRAFGENKVQDLQEKSAILISLPIEWHFVGRLQTNKINNLLKLKPTLIHSIESFEMAQEISKRADFNVKGLLQINSAKEDTKAGVLPDEAFDTYCKIAELLPNIKLQGVMSIGAHVEDETIVQKSFEETKSIFDRLSKYDPKYCSMGMSGDFELAIKCGSNMLRLGSILF